MRGALRILYFIPVFGICQTYSVDNISENAKSVGVVYQIDSKEFEVSNAGRGITRLHRVVTIFDKDRSDEAKISLPYSNNLKLRKVQLSVLDRTGRQVKKYNLSDFKDFAAVDGYTIYSDNRLKYLDLTHHKLPLTYELEVEMIHDGLMFYPDHTFQYPDVYLIKSEFRVILPSSMTLNYRVQNTSEPKISLNEDNNVYEWSTQNIGVLKREPFGPSYDKLLPKVFTTAGEFEIEGYKGSMSSWSDLGEFQRSLFYGLDGLPQETIEEIQELTKDAKSDREKIEIIYQNLQSRFRYVSVQLGIGGWRPFSPEFVDAQGYGDCKALTYYTKSMLESVGIASNYSLIMANSSIEIFDDFSKPRFNHVILSVPLDKDTVWLECTSSMNPAGYLGKATAGKKTLVISDTESVVQTTPTKKSDENVQTRISNVELRENGDATIQIDFSNSGLQHENSGMLGVVNDNLDTQREWLYDYLDIPDFQVDEFSMNYRKEENPIVEIDSKIYVRKLANVAGNRLFVEPNVVSKWKYIPEEIETRTQDVILNLSYLDIDSIYIKIPQNTHLEFDFEPVRIKSRFGEYEARVENNLGDLVYIRRMEVRRGTYPPNSYEELRDFYGNITKADASKIVFKSGT